MNDFRPGGIINMMSSCEPMIGTNAYYQGLQQQAQYRAQNQQSIQALLMAQQDFAQKQPPTKPSQPTKEKSVFSEIAKDIKSFILEYRAVLYFLAAALILDEVIFKGAFRARLQGMADKVIAKVENKISS